MLCDVAGFTTPFMIDSGASINTLDPSEWLRLKAEYENGRAFIYDVGKEKNRAAYPYASSRPLQIINTFKAWIRVDQKPPQFTEFYVINGASKSLLGSDTAKRMRLLKVGVSVDELSCPSTSEVEVQSPTNTLEGEKKLKPFPKCPGAPVEFEIDESVTPTRQNYFFVPDAFREPARLRLRQMEEQDIIERVDGASRWVSGMSAVTKGDKDFRLVVNMKAPNKAIRRRFYHLPTMESIKCKLAGAKRFTKLDLSNAFYHLELSEKSRELTTFMTEEGTYRFKRLLFGVNCAPEMFQERMETVLRGCKGTIVYIDDILVYAKSEEELKRRQEAVIQRLQSNNLTLNTAKCEFDVPSVRFLGHNVSEAGLNLDETKVEAINKFREPRSASELRSFLGLATYMSSFIPKFAEMSDPLWKSARMYGSFTWGKEQRRAFHAVKSAIQTCTMTQGFFDPNDKTELFTDASPVGLGAVLTQTDNYGERRVVAFASKSLSPVERRYAQNEREALGIVWGVERFFYYLLGRHFTIKTDAQGTSYIFKREHQTSRRVLSRAEGWALRLNPYDYDIVHISGSSNIADTPSRLVEGECLTNYEGHQQPWEICSLSANINDIDTQLETMTADDVRRETLADGISAKLTRAIESGAWDDSDADLKKFAFAKHELYVHDDIVMRADRAVMPQTLQRKALEIAHKGHPGMGAMRRLLRTRVWWPLMDREAEAFVQSCSFCVSAARADPPPPMCRQPMPQRPWDCLAIDFCGPFNDFKGIHVLVVMDYFSRYKWAKVMTKTDTGATIKALDELFEWQGYPSRTQSDNGPPFFGSDFKDALGKRGIWPLHSIPLWPQHNGMVESGMKGIKKALAAAAIEGKSARDAIKEHLAAYNAIPHETTEKPPEELLSRRRFRRGLPLFSHDLQLDMQAVRDKDWASKLRGKEYEDKARGAKDQTIGLGDEVLKRNLDTRKLALNFGQSRHTVVSQHRGDLWLQDEEGNRVRRHVTAVRRAPLKRAGNKTAPMETEKDAQQSPQQNHKDTREPETVIPSAVASSTDSQLNSHNADSNNEDKPTSEIPVKRKYVKREYKQTGPLRRSLRRGDVQFEPITTVQHIECGIAQLEPVAMSEALVHYIELVNGFSEWARSRSHEEP